MVQTEPARLDPATIAAAEQVAGVRYTDAERALMTETLARQIALARDRRAVDLPADLPPATRFDPRLPGFAMPPDPGPLRLPAAEAPAPLPADDAAIAFAPVATQSAWIAARAISSERLTQIYLDRARRIGPTLHCFTLLDPDAALARARDCDRMLAAGTWAGPLHGIPWAAKDILDTAALETAYGAETHRGRIPATDAAVVQRLHAAGAVLIGKTSVGALAYGDLWYGGRTRNPWNPPEGSSGSSAGSGSAVAAGLAGFTLGTETLGSILFPSTRCGATGLRPTFGRVARTGAMPLCWSLDKIGPMCRSVADTALVLAAINGADAADPASIEAPFGGDLARPLAGLRLGCYAEDFDHLDADPADRGALAAAEALGLTLVPLTRPALPYRSLMSILQAEAAAAFEDLTLTDRDDLLTWQDADAWPNSFRQARFLSAVDHVQLDRLRRRVMQVMDAAFTQVDAIIGPSLTNPMLVITNFTGHPALCLPVGLRPAPTRHPGGLSSMGDPPRDPASPMVPVPHSITLWGRLFEEDTILAIGLALEAAFGFGRHRPMV